MKLKCFALGAQSRLAALLVAALMLVASLGTGLASAHGVRAARAGHVARAGGAGVSLLSRGAGYGHRGGLRAVRLVQRRLDARGENPGPIDGLYGPLTQAAVERFQRQQGLSVDGIVGAQTRHSLRYSGTARALTRAAGLVSHGGVRQVRRLQRQLRAAGQHPGPIDGLYGPRTQTALQRFERQHGLPATGIAAPNTLTRLQRPGRSKTTQRAQPTAPTPAPPKTLARPRSPSAQRFRPSATGAPTSTPPPRPTPTHAPRPTQPHRTGHEPALVGLGVWAAILLILLMLAVWPRARRAAQRQRERQAPTAPSDAAEPVGPVVPPTRRSAPEAAGQGAEAAAEAAEAAQAGAGTEAAAAGAGAGVKRLEVPVVGYVTASAGSVNGHELKAQTEVIARECARRGLALLQVVHEREPDNVKAHTRPGFGYALRRIASGEAQGLVVSELAQLTRSATELGAILQWFSQAQARFISVGEALDTGQRDGRLAARTLVEVSAWERARLGERTRNGLQAARHKQRPNGRSAVSDHPELRERIAQMRSEGMTLKAIADQLNQEGVPTVRGGIQWRPSSVQTAIGYQRRRPTPTDLLTPQAQGEEH
jgi:peptidoglycan hydrolase-like protein with peptidoglycan-binding domain/DNA invertase Pin-like site-specific DNA recombinase